MVEGVTPCYALMQSRHPYQDSSEIDYWKYLENYSTKTINLTASLTLWRGYNIFFWLDINGIKNGEDDQEGIRYRVKFAQSGTLKFEAQVFLYYDTTTKTSNFKLRVYDWTRSLASSTQTLVVPDNLIDSVFFRVTILNDPDLDKYHVVINASPSVTFENGNVASAGLDDCTPMTINEVYVTTNTYAISPGIFVVASPLLINDLQEGSSFNYESFPYEINDYGLIYHWPNSVSARRFFVDNITEIPYVCSSPLLKQYIKVVDEDISSQIEPIMEIIDDIDAEKLGLNAEMDCAGKLFPRIRCLVEKMISSPQEWVRSLAYHIVDGIVEDDPGDYTLIAALYTWLGNKLEEGHVNLLALVEQMWGKKQ